MPTEAKLSLSYARGVQGLAVAPQVVCLRFSPAPAQQQTRVSACTNRHDMKCRRYLRVPMRYPEQLQACIHLCGAQGEFCAKAGIKQNGCWAENGSPGTCAW